MKTYGKTLLSILTLSALASLFSAHNARSQGTTFTYQGRLADAGSAVSGNYDLRFTVWDLAVGGLQVGAPVVVAPVPVSSGLFSVPLNFGMGVFTGPPRWLQIESRVFGGGAYSTITPRQQLTAAPYAITAGTITGTLPTASLPCPIADTCLSPNVALLNRNPQTFTGQNYFNNRVGIGTTTPGYPLHVNGDTRVDGAVFLNHERVAVYQGSTGRFGGANGWSPNPLAQGVFLESGINESGGFYADGDVAVIWSPGDADLLRVYDEDLLPGGAPSFVINGDGYVGVLTPNPLSPLHVAGQFLRVDGAGGEVAYLGGDGAGNDIQVGSLNPSVGNVALFNAASATYMNLVAQDVSYGGLLNKLDVADNFTATVRAADFTLGHSSRRGTPGRALVDFGTSLIVNFGSDWADTIIGSRFSVSASDMFMGRSKVGHFFGATGFDFNPAAPATVGYMIEQGFSGGSLNESAGIYLDADSITMWSPGDNGRLLRLLDEDGMVERFYIDGSGNAVANGVVLTSSRRFKENIAPIANALDKVLRLQGVTFDWIKERGGQHGIGFIAEDMAEVLPELVLKEENGKDAVGLQYANVTAVTVEAIKELKAQKDEEIAALKKKNAQMESRLADLEAREKARELRFSALEKLLQQQTAGHVQKASLKTGVSQ